MEVPPCFVGLFHGDWDEAGYATQRFSEAHVHPPMPDGRYPWAQYNSWGYGQDIHEAQQMEAIERCAALGVEAVVMDLGWAVQIGEWRADPAKFPRGLAPLADRAHALGMKFGVHIPLAQANVNSPIARAHPEWLTVVANDYFGAAALCLGHRPCREWLIGEIVRFIDDYHLDYIVQDGEDMVKLCRRTDHTHAPGDSNYANSHEGLDAVIQAVLEAHPRLVWENCEDGGCMLTYRMARLCHSTITVDNIATYATRQGVYGASYPFSPRYSVRYMQDAPTPYTLRSAIFGGPLILMQQVTEWDAAQMAATRKAIEEYVALRELVRDAKIIHLLPPRNNLEGQGWGWDAIQAVSADRSRSVAMAYRARGGPDEQAIHPRGLLSDATYRISYADRSGTSALTGAALADTGIALTLPEFGSEIVHMEQITR
jgi:alpha-galactosidase